MSADIFSPDAWTRARNRFMEDLDEQEKQHFFQATAETILYDVSAAEKLHERDSTSGRILKKIQPLVEAVAQYGEAIDVYASTYPLAMGPLWGSIRVVLLLAREAGKYFEKLADMFDRISDVLPRLRVYEQLFPNHERLVQAMSLVYFDVLDFCIEAKKVLRRGKRSLMKLVWRPFDHQFGSRIEVFRDHMKRTEKEVSTSHMIEAADSRALIRSNHDQLTKERYDAERFKVFSTLSTINYEAQHARLKRLRLEGTGNWLLEHPAYLDWKRSSTSNGLCCYGIPGSGKSILASLIIDDNIATSTPQVNEVIYHYCDYAESATLQPLQIYRALMQQLFLKGLMAESIVKQVVEKTRRKANSLNEQDLATLICTAISTGHGVNIVLDGLDECDRDAQRNVVDLFHQLFSKDQGRARVLVTCRTEGHLLKDLGQFRQFPITTNYSLNDIEAFVISAIERKFSAGDLIIRDLALKEEIIARLVAKAQGMFLWVHFQINDLCEAASDYAIREVLEHLPDGLHDTYSRIVSKIQASSNSAIVIKVMQWVACARRTLSLEELQEAVAFDRMDRSWDLDKVPNGDKIIRSCFGLVIRDDGDGKVRYAHHTVRQFLLPVIDLAIPPSDPEPPAKTSFDHPSPLSFTLGEAETMAGHICATYLCFSDFETAIAKVEDSKQPDLIGIFKGRGPIAIPTVLGLGAPLDTLTYRFLGVKDDVKMPSIDYSKYLSPKAYNPQPPSSLTKKYAFLEYIVEYWPWHTRWLSSGGGSERFWDLILNKSLSFEIRPWGPNQHFGPYGCKGCPTPELDDFEHDPLPHMSLLHWAAETGHVRLLQSVPTLIQYLNHERYHHETFLIACQHNQDTFVDVLLELNADISSEEQTMRRAIMTTCKLGLAATLETLLREYVDTHPSSFEAFGNEFLCEATRCDQEFVVDMLIDKGVHPSGKDLRTGMTALHQAAINGNLHAFQALCSATRPNILKYLSAKDEISGMTALHHAASHGHDSIVKYVLGYKPGLDESSKHGYKALTDATQNRHHAFVQFLLEQRANASTIFNKEIGGWWIVDDSSIVDIPDDEKAAVKGLAAIHYAARQGHDKVLQALPVSVYSMTEGPDKSNALHLAANAGHTAAIEVLLARAPSLCQSQDFLKMTALHYAARAGHLEAADILINGGIMVDWAGITGFTALHYAAGNGHIEIIKLLIARGAEIETEASDSYHGFTALHLAARHADKETITFLVNSGAPLEEEDREECTALRIAVDQGRSANAFALIRLGAQWQEPSLFQSEVLNVLRQAKMFYLFWNRLSVLGTDEKFSELYEGSPSNLRRLRKSLASKGLDETLLPDEAWDDDSTYETDSDLWTVRGYQFNKFDAVKWDDRERALKKVGQLGR